MSQASAPASVPASAPSPAAPSPVIPTVHGAGEDWPRVEADRVWLRLGSRWVLKAVSCTLAGPGVHLVLGGPRSGKSSLLSVLSGQRQPDQGACRIRGEPAHQLSPETAGRVATLDPDAGRRRQIELRLMRWGSHLPPHARAHWDEAFHEHARQALALPDRGLLCHQAPGIRRRLAWASLLAARPQLLWLDEPLKGMDRADAQACLDLLAAWQAGRPATVVWSDQDTATMAHLATHVHLLGQRQLWFSCPVQDLPGRVLAWRWEGGPQASQWRLPPTLGRVIRSHDGTPARKAWVLDCPPSLATEVSAHLQAHGAADIRPVAVSWTEAVASLMSAGPLMPGH